MSNFLFEIIDNRVTETGTDPDEIYNKNWQLCNIEPIFLECCQGVWVTFYIFARSVRSM